jgi:hypothetical protein
MHTHTLTHTHTINPIKASVCIFKPGERVVTMALYPPPGSTPDSQHANCTSQDIKKVTENSNFDWNDLFPVASPPETKCKDVDLDAVH